MNLTKREFMQVLAPPAPPAWAWGACRRQRADGGRGAVRHAAFGNVSLLHMTDCHAQLNRSTSASPASTWASAT
jgi:sulfur-oxidizing protein SoxB